MNHERPTGRSHVHRVNYQVRQRRVESLQTKCKCTDWPSKMGWRQELLQKKKSFQRVCPTFKSVGKSKVKTAENSTPRNSPSGK